MSSLSLIEEELEEDEEEDEEDEEAEKVMESSSSKTGFWNDESNDDEEEEKEEEDEESRPVFPLWEVTDADEDEDEEDVRKGSLIRNFFGSSVLVAEDEDDFPPWSMSIRSSCILFPLPPPSTDDEDVDDEANAPRSSIIENKSKICARKSILSMNST